MPENAQKVQSTRFGRYELLRRIGFGGMGEVWLALLPGLSGINKLCVVKRILPHLAVTPNFVERFLDEAKVVVQLAHGNIAQVFEMGQEGEEYFLAMEYVEGKPLGKIITKLRDTGERVPMPVALYVAIRTLDGLAYAHRRTDPMSGKPLKVVHRDISPSNILVSYEGQVKIVDFGAAHSTLKGVTTGPRLVIGNLAYMSPEQARKKPVDARADVYSTAVVLWEMLSWQPMPLELDKNERWRRAAYPNFEPPSKFNPEVPASLDAIVMRGLAQDLDARYPSADLLRDDLQRALSQLDPNASQSTLGAFMQRHFAPEARQDRAMLREVLGALGGAASALSEESSFSEMSLPQLEKRLEALSEESTASMSETRPAPKSREEEKVPTMRIVHSPHDGSARVDSSSRTAPADDEEPTVTVTQVPGLGEISIQTGLPLASRRAATKSFENEDSVTVTVPTRLRPAPRRRPGLVGRIEALRDSPVVKEALTLLRRWLFR